MASPSSLTLMVALSQTFWSLSLCASYSPQAPVAWGGPEFVICEHLCTFRISLLTLNPILGHSHLYHCSQRDFLLKGHQPPPSLQLARGGSWLIKTAMAGDFSFSSCLVLKLKKIAAYFKLEQWL